MALFDLFKNFLDEWGRATNERIANRPENLKYLEKYSGRWVNVGTSYNEDWQWIPNDPFADERNSKYVSVMESETDDSYILVISEVPKEGAIDFVDCINEKEIKLALELYPLQYMMKGNFKVIEE